MTTPTEQQVKRVVAFVDGQALYYAAREAFGYKHVNYDVAALSQAVCRQQTWELAQTRFYTGVPVQTKDPSGHYFWTLKLMQMRRQGVHVFTRDLKYREIPGTHRDGYSGPTFIPREKGVDIRLALDVVKLAHEKAYDIALIFSQDQDFTEVVDDLYEIAKQQIRCIEVASAFPCSPKATNKHGINRTTEIKIDRATYDACLDHQNYSPTPIALKEPGVQSDEDRFLDELEAKRGYVQREFAQHILMHAKMRTGKVEWKIPDKVPRAVWLLQHGTLWLPLFLLSTAGMITIPVSTNTVRKVVRTTDLKVSFLQKLNTVPGISIRETDCDSSYHIPLNKLLNLDAVDLFFDAIDWWIAEIGKLPIVEEEEEE